MTKEQLKEMSVWGHLYLNSIRPSDGFYFLRKVSKITNPYASSGAHTPMDTVHECDELFNEAGKIERKIEKLSRKGGSTKTISAFKKKAASLRKQARELWQKEIEYALTL